MEFNKVYFEDILDFISKVPDDTFDLVYGDPDYNVGIKYNGISYTRSFDEYMRWYGKLAKECIRVMKPSGNLFMINYAKQNSYLRVNYLDSLCKGVWDYSWVYNTNIGHSKRHFTVAHRSVLHGVKSDRNNFYKEAVAVPYKNLNDKRIRKRMLEGSTGCMPYSWFYFDLVKNVSRDKKDHPCQIPLDLFRLLLNATTVEGDSVFVLFGGSGNELLECQRQKRNWVSCELDESYYLNIVSMLEGSV